METIDFSPETAKKHFPGKMLMGFITPTTTMMREGITQAATDLPPQNRSKAMLRSRVDFTKEEGQHSASPIKSIKDLLILYYK